MRRNWLMAVALSGAATAAAHAADVQIFGVHTPETGNWAVYTRISNTASRTPTAGKETVAGISSIAVNVLNNTVGVNTAAIDTLKPDYVVNMLPMGSTDLGTDPLYGPIGYGFWFARSSLTPSAYQYPIVTDASGVKDIRAAQYTLFDPGSEPPATYNPLVLQAVGIAAGAQAVGGNKTSAVDWTQPVLVAKGKYVATATTGAGGEVGLKLEYSNATGVNLLQDTDPSAAVNWTGPSAGDGSAHIEESVSKLVADARAVIGTPVPPGAQAGVTVRGGLGDANLDGTVGFADLLKVAQNYDLKGTWFDGDFDYDGAIGFSDLLIVAQRYDQAVPADVPSSEAFQADWNRALSMVPEPGSVGLIGLGVLGMLAIRRRRSGR